MLTALKEIGEILLDKENKSEIDILLENPDSSGKYKIVWVLEFDKDLNFKGISIEEFKGEKPYIYLYKFRHSVGAHYSPTGIDKSVETKFNQRIMQWLKKHANIPEIQKIYEELTKNKEDIIKQLKELDTQAGKDNGKILTLKINGKYLYEVDKPNFKEILLKDFMSEIKQVSKDNAICSICGEKKIKSLQLRKFLNFITLIKNAI